jgi:hypothetical protein
MDQPNKPTQINQNGSIIVTILVIMLFLSTVIFSLISLANTNMLRSRERIMLLQTLYAAESGADTAIAYLNNQSDTYSGSDTEKILINENAYKATYQTTVSTNGDQKIIVSTGKLYAPADSNTAKYTKRIEVIARRTSDESTLSMVSRNIINIESGVKNVFAKDIYVNGYITMSKNTTNLVAENITVAGRNTSAQNCSIGGTGNLIKPTSFTTPGQTKTNIRVAFNNCINPPGNNSNTDFNVTANLNTLTQIQSTMIPVSQYMDNSYHHADSCTDWTTGLFPRNIPITNNSKKTHYPDDLNGVSTDCGNSGDLSLSAGQYNIRDHVHIRANLCAASACSPTFYNPDQGADGIKFIFVEGNVNFASVQTASGSGPIALVIYGPDPASKSSVCPNGGSFYLGNSDDTSAPALYVTAQNGACLDKTKFANTPAFGGVTGKNIYIATNPGTPFDLALDPNYPVASIPINLAWKAEHYRKL